MDSVTYTTSDGDKMRRYKMGSTTVIECIEVHPSTYKGLKVPEGDDADRPQPTVTRATRMRELIAEGKDRNTIKSTLVSESYNVATFASEWFRLNK